jgi:hypothetical protein
LRYLTCTSGNAVLAAWGEVVNTRVFRVIAVAAVAGFVLAATAGVAMAVSGGGYDPGQQDCPKTADASNAGPGSWQSQNPVPHCHNAAVNVEDGNGNRFAEVGLDQLPSGYPSTPGLTGVGYPQTANFPHSGCAAVNTAGTGGGTGTGCGNNPKGLGGSAGFDTNQLLACVYQNVWLPDPTHIRPPPGSPPSASCTPGSNPAGAVTGSLDTGGGMADFVATLLGPGVKFYMGADDNLDAGEHDGVTGLNNTANSANGPSDGGAITAHLTPSRAGDMPSATNPLPAAGASEGECADGLCFGITTHQQALYNGGGSGSRDVYNYDGKTWDPYNCSSGDPKSEQACSDPAQGGHPGGMDYYKSQEAGTVNAEPGVQVYEDPDPQGSPIDPVREGGGPTVLYPLVGTYAGTCGVVAGGGPVAGPVVAGTPVPQNKSGQVVINPVGC